eukprot:SAG31_NODE_4101_length_3583_cov_1.895522_2_plen_153_part_00
MWWMNVWVLFFVCPIYYVACNGKACDGCSLSGIFKPERPKPIAPPVDSDEHEVPVPPPSPEPGQQPPPPRQPYCSKCRELLKDFASAFADPCFRWHWLYSLNSSFAGIIAGTFTFYWYQVSEPEERSRREEKIISLFAMAGLLSTRVLLLWI